MEERDVSADVVEYAVYGAPGELPALPDLRAAAGGALVEVATTRGRRRLGRALARRSTAGRPSAGALHVRAPWHAAPAARRSSDVVIDPGAGVRHGRARARRGCAWSCCSSSSRAARVVDLGCGSGVLAIAAAKLGFGPVLGVDHEPESRSRPRATTRASTASTVEARRYDLIRDGPAPAAPTVLANLLGPLLLPVARGRLRRTARARGR